ncbi:MAG: damage-control phosphatase ARMT1 family protein [Candidatus Heimdallarchaeaceae archaeon]
MKKTEGCYDCILRFCKRVIDKTNQYDELEKVKEMIRNSSSDLIPAVIVGDIWKFLTKDLENKDVFKKEKMEVNIEVKKIIENLDYKKFSFKDFVKLSIFGNLIDIFMNSDTRISDPKKIKERLELFLSEPFAIDDTDKLEKLIENSTIFYITDNPGEIGFDNFFIKKILEKAKKVYIGVKDDFYSNDTTIEDALFFDMNKLGKIIEFPAVGGFWIDSLKGKNKKAFDECNIIISKGQANFETLTEQKSDKPIVYLLRTKCPYISRYLGVPINSNICWIKI